MSLLERVARDLSDEVAWGEFVDRYAPRIYGWCRGWGLQNADAEDVTQAVLLKLAAKIRRFAYDPSKSFRGWLRTLAGNALSDWAADARARSEGGDLRSPLLSIASLENVAAGEDLARRLEEEFDLELLEEATRRVRGRVSATTWQAFQYTAIGGLSGAEAAERLGMSLASVYMAKSNVLASLRIEVQALDTPSIP